MGTKVVEVDFTAPEALDALRDELAGAGAVLAFADVKQALSVRLSGFGLAAKMGSGKLLPTEPGGNVAGGHHGP